MCLSLFDKKLNPKTNNIVIKFGMQKRKKKKSLTNQFHISNLALLCDEIVKSRLSLVKTRVEFSIELYRNVGNDHSSSRSVLRSFSFKHKSILLRMLVKIYTSQYFSKVFF